MANPVEFMGRLTLGAVSEFGRIARFAGDVWRNLFRGPVRFARTIDAVYDLGVLSVVLIATSGFAVGAVLGLQGYTTLVRFGAEQSLGAVVGLSLIRELGPVLTGLLVTGRAGSSVAAEIGAMVATEQLDGLRMMSVNPIHFVVLPKALAMAIVMPLLSAIFIVFAIFGGYVVGVELLALDGGTYLASLEGSVDFREDVVGSILKAWIFGLIVGLIATYRGYTSEPNAAGVSRATTSTVVIASVTILFSDYFITALWGV
jgi:phospholipid/cholesterol/gamma-HCH transport system permease protein